MKSAVVEIGDTATPINTDGGTASAPVSILVRVPADGASVFLGGPDVTTANGFEVAPAESFNVELLGDILFGAVASGTQDVQTIKNGG